MLPIAPLKGSLDEHKLDMDVVEQFDVESIVLCILSMILFI